MKEFAATFEDRSALTFKFWFDAGERADFYSLEVWRSTVGEGGPYQELTGDAWAPAVLRSSKTPGGVVGKTLDLLVGTSDISVTFTGVHPLSTASIAEQIQEASAGLLTSSAETVGISIATVDVGSKARLEVTGGSAAPLLGFSTYPPTNRAYGTDARVRFVAGRSSYTFEDAWGKKAYWYKTRMRRLDGTVSEFSVPFNSNATRAVSPEKLILGWLRLVDFEGRPIANRSILLSTRGAYSLQAEGNVVVDLADKTLLTDDTGYCSTLVLRGIELTVGVAGTNMVRDVRTPEDSSVDSFNLFDPAVGLGDAFAVSVPRLDIAQRRECF